jgi:cation diffusion facilitator CzcD-associated flavoprotein CzcO
VENTLTGEKIEDDADILLSARGNLNEIVWPSIPGFTTFKGEVMHSAAWNQEYAFYNRQVTSLIIPVTTLPIKG